MARHTQVYPLGDSPLLAGGGWSWRVVTMLLLNRFSETIPIIAIGNNKFLAATRDFPSGPIIPGLDACND